MKIKSYKKIINNIDTNHKDVILKFLEKKIQIMFNDGIANKAEIELIESMIKLVHILNINVDLPKQIIQEIYLPCHTLLMKMMKYQTLRLNLVT